jgi:hypothetical protein
LSLAQTPALTFVQLQSIKEYPEKLVDDDDLTKKMTA